MNTGRDWVLWNRKRIKKSIRANGAVGKVWVKLSIIGGGVTAALMFVVALRSGDVSRLVLSLLTIGIYTRMIWLLRRRPSHRKLRTLPNELDACIRAVLGTPARELGIDTQSLIILVDVDATSSSANVELVDNKPTLIVSLGFLKTVRSDVDIAAAILTHELGHLDQNDLDLLARPYELWIASRRVALSFVILIVIFSIVQAGIQIAFVYNELPFEIRAQETMRIANERRISRDSMLFKLRQQLGGTTAAEVDMSEFSRSMNNLLNDSAVDIIKSQAQHEAVAAALPLWTNAWSMFWFLAAFYAVHSLRRLAEEGADLAVVLYGDGSALERALQSRSGGGRSHMLALHPAIKKRRKLVKKYMHALSQ
jgi:Zn-dependent protease with chaperone function